MFIYDEPMEFSIMWKDDVIADVYISAKELKVCQDSSHPRKVFYKEDSQIDRFDILWFVEDQIFDEHNARRNEILEELGLEEYSVWDIFYKTRGISFRNKYWAKFKGDDFEYERDITTRKFMHKIN